MRHFLFPVLALALSSPAWADGSCPPPKIIYEARVSAPSVDRSLSVASLSGASDPQTHGDSEYPHILGNYISGRSLSVQLSAESISGKDGSSYVCVSKARIEHFMSPSIRLASDMPAGSCSEKEIWSHELQHFSIDRDALISMRSSVESLASRGSWRSGIFRSKAETDAFLENHQIWLLKRVNADFQRMTVDRQVLLDLGADYDRIDRVCSGETNRIASAAQKSVSGQTTRRPTPPAHQTSDLPSPVVAPKPAAPPKALPSSAERGAALAKPSAPAKAIYGGSNPWIPR